MNILNFTLSLPATLLACLLLTIGIECGVAASLFRLRRWYDLSTVTLAQLVTNPLVVVIGQLTYPALSTDAERWTILLLLELLALGIEALLYRYAHITTHPWRLSILCNLVSFCAGIMLQHI